MSGRRVVWTMLGAVGVLGCALLQGGCGEILEAFALAEVSVETHELVFDSVEGEDPEPQDVGVSCTIPNTDALFFDEPCRANVTTDQTWLYVDPGTIYGDDFVHVGIDTTDLAPGTYTGNIHAEYELVSLDDEEDIAVTLTVRPAESSEE